MDSWASRATRLAHATRCRDAGYLSIYLSIYLYLYLSIYLRARAVEGVAEEVAQDGVAQPLHAAKAAVHPPAEVRLLVELLERIDGRQDGVEDVLDLCEPCSEEVSSEFKS